MKSYDNLHVTIERYGAVSSTTEEISVEDLYNTFKERLLKHIEESKEKVR